MLKLDAIRGFAAFYVVIHHLVAFSPELRSRLSSVGYLPFRFGQEAVILFFLLSGFVVAASVGGRHFVVRDYIEKRVVRIYPLFLFSLLISFLLCSHLPAKIELHTDLKTLVGNLLMWQDLSNKPGNRVSVYAGNDPLWSLSYEFWFYALYIGYVKFQAHFRLDARSMFYSVVLVSALAWLCYLRYNSHAFLVITYFSIWCLGVYSHDLYAFGTGLRLRNYAPVMLVFSGLTLLILIPVFNYYRRSIPLIPILYPTLVARHFVFALVAILTGLAWYRTGLIGYRFILAPFAFFAPFSYALYVLHFPFIFLHFPLIQSLGGTILVKLALIFSVAYFSDMYLQHLIVATYRQFKDRQRKLSPLLVT